MPTRIVFGPLPPEPQRSNDPHGFASRIRRAFGTQDDGIAVVEPIDAVARALSGGGFAELTRQAGGSEERVFVNPALVRYLRELPEHEAAPAEPPEE